MYPADGCRRLDWRLVRRWYRRALYDHPLSPADERRRRMLSDAAERRIISEHHMALAEITIARTWQSVYRTGGLT